MAIKIYKANGFGIITGLFYGICLRLIIGGKSSDLFSIMSVGFVFLVPLVLGVLTVAFATNSTWAYCIFAPWIPILLFVLATAVFGLEGVICIVMALPVFLFMASLGGVLTKIFSGFKKTTRVGLFTGFLFLPLISSAIESQFALPLSQRTVPTEIIINASPGVVWKNIIRIPHIQPQEHHDSFFHLMGFPKPVEATLSHEGIGGVRHASFEKGLLFIETIQEWQEQKKIVFSIKANTESIPPTTLDEHVTIGGAYFDMLQGAYEIEALAPNQVRLHLSSTQRLSTRFNAYTAIWTEAIMRDIQDYILVIIKNRCESSVSKI